MIRLEQDIVYIGDGLIENLIQAAHDSLNRRARIVIGDEDAPIQEMFICLLKDSYVRPHRHPPEKSESYLVVTGEMDVKLYKPDGGVHRTLFLTEAHPYYRQKGGWYHQPVAASEFVVYKETYSGKWRKDKDVEYASWAPEEK